MVSYYVYPGLKYSELSQKQRHHIGQGRKGLNPDKILSAVSEYYGIETADIKSGSRKREFVWCRQVFYHFAVIYTGMTLLQIGDYIGGRDHTTVIHGKQTVKDMIETYPDKIKELKEIEYMICFHPTIGNSK